MRQRPVDDVGVSDFAEAVVPRVAATGEITEFTLAVS